MRRTLPIFLVAALLLGLALNALAQDGGVTWKPMFAYAFLIPEDGPIIGRPVGELGLTYLLPLTANGEHNLKVGGLGGGSSGDEGFSNTGFLVGYAVAPEEVKGVVFGVAATFDAFFPTDDLAAKMVEDPKDDTWILFGPEGSLDFKIGPLPGALVAGYRFGIRGAPDEFYFAFGLTMQSVGAEETVKRTK